MVQGPGDVKSWKQELPSVGAVRPSHCPRCRRPSRETGQRITLHGHGVRRRQQRGPEEPEGKPVEAEIVGRRFRCILCRAVIIVVPHGVLPHRHYGAGAIALAAALYGVDQRPVTEVRQRVSTWDAGGTFGWITLRRWLRSIRCGELFPGIRRCPTEWTPRQVAARAATTLAGWAPPSFCGLPVRAQAFHGASRQA